jgi:hypothetical protein
MCIWVPLGPSSSGFTISQIGGMMGHAQRPTDQTRGRPRLRRLRGRVHGLRPRFFYWDDVAGRRMRPEQMTGAQALELAELLARGLSILLLQGNSGSRRRQLRGDSWRP